MSQRNSGHARIERDLYETPEWVTEVVLPHLRTGLVIHEPAAGSGKMVRALARGGRTVTASDIATGVDFLRTMETHEAIVTNPPYEQAAEFIAHSLTLTKTAGGFVAMLLRTDFDHARTRETMFGKHKWFSKKVVLTRRIKWFEDSTGSPSFNHAWFIWDWKHTGAPTLAYGP